MVLIAAGAAVGGLSQAAGLFAAAAAAEERSSGASGVRSRPHLRSGCGTDRQSRVARSAASKTCTSAISTAIDALLKGRIPPSRLPNPWKKERAPQMTKGLVCSLLLAILAQAASRPAGAAPAIKTESGRLQKLIEKLAGGDYVLGEPNVDKLLIIGPRTTIMCCART
jgi:hypothetical protein